MIENTNAHNNTTNPKKNMNGGKSSTSTNAPSTMRTHGSMDDAEDAQQQQKENQRSISNARDNDAFLGESDDAVRELLYEQTTSKATLKKNPRDAASPRRRSRSSKQTNLIDNSNDNTNNAKDFGYDGPVVLISGEGGRDLLQLDTYSIQSSRQGSISHSVTSSSVGGLPYIDTPQSGPNSNTNAHGQGEVFKPSFIPFDSSQGYASSNSNAYPYAANVGTNASVSSRSTSASKHSRMSFASKSVASKASQSQAHSQAAQSQYTQDSVSVSPPLVFLDESNLRSNDVAHDPDQEEQLMFEQRLCNDEYGVAVRKINSNGKSQLRYVKCITYRDNTYRSEEDDTLKNMSQSVPPEIGSSRPVSSARSVTSLMGRITRKSYSNKRDKDIDNNSSTVGNGNRSRANSRDSYASNTNTINNSSQSPTRHSSTAPNYIRALTWGNKKKVKIPLHKFIAIRKGKTTDRTRRNACPPSRLLSLITSDKRNSSLDIEAPTRLDRDKFAKAFSRFLGVKLEEDGGIVGTFGNIGIGLNMTMNNTVATAPIEDVKQRKGGKSKSSRQRFSAAHSAPGDNGSSVGSLSSSIHSQSTNNSIVTPRGEEHLIGGGTGLLPSMTPSPSSSKDDAKFLFEADGVDEKGAMLKYSGPQPSALDGKKTKAGLASKSSAASNSNTSGLISGLSAAAMKRVEDNNVENSKVSSQPNSDRANQSHDLKINKVSSTILNPGKTDHSKSKSKNDGDNDNDDASDVSSLTQGYDQEIVEELHLALNELRAELEASRAEAARAVKVAEQAIQSAESCSSNDWNSTVTHKAAEAAAQAQKRSAEAMAKQRLAEERLAAEKKSALFWRKQAEIAEEEAGTLQTRAAAAEVQRANIAAELEREKRKTANYVMNLKRDFTLSERIQRENLASSAEQNRLLEIELDGTRRDLEAMGEETKTLQDALVEIKTTSSEGNKAGNKKKFFGSRAKKVRGPLLLDSPTSSTSGHLYESTSTAADKIDSEKLLKLNAETAAIRKQFELLRLTTEGELRQLPEQAVEWANQAARAMAMSQAEINTLKEQLSLEVTNRRKLLHEVQDLRGTVRVYCRPKPTAPNGMGVGTNGIISVETHEIGLLHRDTIPENGGEQQAILPMSFEFDRMFRADTSQNEIYSELEELILGVLDGYNVCMMAYGQTGSGKTHTLIGDFVMRNGANEVSSPQVDVSCYGMHLLAAQQLFSIAQHRSERYQDSFTLSIVEVHHEKLRDMVAGTQISESCGQIQGREGKIRLGRNKGSKEEDGGGSQMGETSSKSSKPSKLEIRTNYDGDTIVQGLVSIPVHSFDDVLQVWKESLAARSKRLKESGIELNSYEASCHVIATLQVVSTNITTGVGTVGKIQFVDLAGSDVVPKRNPILNKSKVTSMDDMLAPVGNVNEWRFVDKSLSTLADVVNSRSKFTRSVPYRNSTLTHLLRDSLEGDTKVLLMLCVSSEARDLQNSANSMRFGSKMRKVVVGKATKHTVSLA